MPEIFWYLVSVLFLSAIIHFFVAGLFAVLVNRIGLIPWKRASNTHWSEQARLLWPVRFTAAISVFAVPFLLNQLHWYLFPASHNESNWILDYLAALAGVIFGCYPLDRQIFPTLDFNNWWRQTLALWGMRFGIWAVFIAGLILMPLDFGLHMLLVVIGYLLVHLLLQWGLLLKYLRITKFATPAGPRLQQIVVATIAAIGGVKVRATWELGGCLATAFAFPTTHELVFSKRTLETCSDEEVAAIAAHEIAHLKESKLILAARLFGSLTIFPLLFINPAIHLLGPSGLFVPAAAAFAMIFYTKWLSQRMEKKADNLAVKEQSNEGVYARALEKLYRENQTPAVNVNNRQTHPHLYDRMLAAGITPDFPRPGRPKRFTLIGWTLIFLVAFLIVKDILPA